MAPPSKPRTYSKYIKGKAAVKMTATTARRAQYRQFPRSGGTKDETKVVDLANAAYAFDNTGSIVPINLLRTGTSFVNRIGRKTAMKSLYINGKIQQQAASVGETYCRMIVVYDSQTNGAVPTWADVVSSFDQAGAVTSTVVDGFNLNNRDRFRIILDHRINMPQIVGNVSDSLPSPTATEVTVNEYRKLGGLETIYKADTSPAVIGDIATGSLIILTLGDQAAASGYNFIGTVRLRFQDN